MNSFYKKLLNCRPYIVNNLIAIDDVTDALLSEGVLSSSSNEEIKLCPCDSNRVRKLLDYLGKKTDTAFKIFCSALNSTGNEHISSMLTSGETSRNNIADQSVPPVNNRRSGMNNNDKDILRKLRVYFVKNMIDIEGVIDILFSEDIIKESHKNLILKHQERSNQVRSLLDILSKRYNNTMSVFIKALEETDNMVLVNKIKEHHIV